MAKFGKTSKSRLLTCHPKLQMVFNEVIKKHDCSIVYGSRSIEEQQRLVDAELSQTMHSKHLIQPDTFSHATDAAPYPIDWNNTKRFYWFAGLIIATAESMNVKIRWGGDWDSDDDLDDQKFMDLVHFELVE